MGVAMLKAIINAGREVDGLLSLACREQSDGENANQHKNEPFFHGGFPGDNQAGNFDDDPINLSRDIVLSNCLCRCSGNGFLARRDERACP